MRVIIYFFILFFSTTTYAQDNFGFNDLTAILANSTWSIKKQCRDQENCRADSSFNYCTTRKESCTKDSCSIFSLTMYGFRIDEADQNEFVTTIAHNPSFSIRKKNRHTKNIFLIRYYRGEGRFNKAVLTITSKNNFTISGDISDEGEYICIYFSREPLPVGLSEFIERRKF